MRTKQKTAKWQTECQWGRDLEAACAQAVILAAIQSALKGS